LTLNQIIEGFKSEKTPTKPLNGAARFTEDILKSIDLAKYPIFGEAKVSENLSGPIGLAMLTSKVSERGLDQIYTFAAMISLSLAVFNFLPIPALDGGRIVFVLIEAITRRKVKVEVEQIIHSLGFLLLLLLMVFVSYYDLVKAVGF
jgi:regulator of sigma E protease